MDGFAGEYFGIGDYGGNHASFLDSELRELHATLDQPKIKLDPPTKPVPK